MIYNEIAVSMEKDVEDSLTYRTRSKYILGLLYTVIYYDNFTEFSYSINLFSCDKKEQ